MTDRITKYLSNEFIIGMIIQAAVFLTVSAAWTTGTARDIKVLQEKAVIATADHDTLVQLRTDVASIKDAMNRIANKLDKKEASNGQ
jgi:hypothetical protein